MITVENAFFTYPSGVKALEGLNLEIQDGEFIGIMGENGAGKTTLVKHFNGLLKPTNGDIYINGKNTRETTVAELSKNVGLVFQNPDHQLFCETVEEEVTFGLKNFGFAEEKIVERTNWVLKFLELERYRKSSPFILSGGERKRVALAAVLAWDPNILVLDEPTIGQDYLQKERLRQYIEQLNGQGRTVIIVTHDIEFIAECKPRIIVLSKGKIINDAPAKEALTNSENLSKASIFPPQIAQLFIQIADLGLPKDVIDVYEAKVHIENLLKGGKRNEGV
jgi:energy-coupling factor transport system ATP-binding protein